MPTSLSDTHRRVALTIQALATGHPVRITTPQLVAAAGVSRRSAQYAVGRLVEMGAVIRFGDYDRLLQVNGSHPLWAELEGGAS